MYIIYKYTHTYIYYNATPQDLSYVLDILFLTAYVYCHFLWHYRRKAPFQWEWHEKLNNVHTTNLFEFGYCIVTLAGPCSSKLQSCVKWAQHCGQMQGLKHVIFMSLHLIDAQFRHRLWNNFSCLVSKIFLKGLLSGSYWMADVGWWEEPCNLYLAHMTPSPVCKRLQTLGFKIQDARLPEHFLNRRIWVQDWRGWIQEVFWTHFESWIQGFANVCKRDWESSDICIYIYICVIYIYMISPSSLVIILTIIHSNRWSGNIYIYIHMYLVGGFNPSEKYEFVSWDDYSQDMEKYKKCSKPPIRYVYIYTFQLNGLFLFLHAVLCTMIQPWHQHVQHLLCQVSRLL